MSLAEKDKWLCRDVFEIFPATEAVRASLECCAREGGVYTRLDDLIRLAFIAKLVEPKTIFEIGTYKGRTALTFALNSPGDCTVYTLDLPPQAKALGMQRACTADAKIIDSSLPGLDYEGKDVSARIVQLYGNSLDFDFTPYAGKMDLVFVDGAHDYDAVRLDTINALKMLSPNGVLIWDDFADYGDYNDVTRAVLDILPGTEVIQVAATHIALYLGNRRNPSHSVHVDATSSRTESRESQGIEAGQASRFSCIPK